MDTTRPIPEGRVLLSIREYAKLVGVSHTAVLKRVRSGKLPTVNGRIDPEAAGAAWEQNQDPDAALREQSAARTRASKRADSRPPAAPAAQSFRKPPAAQPGPLEDFLGNKAKREFVRLQKETLELGRIRGKLLDVDEVKKAVGAMIIAAHSTLLAIPPKVAPKLSAETDPLKCQDIVEAAIHEALAKLKEFECPAGT